MSLWRYSVKIIIATRIPTPKTAYAVKRPKKPRSRKHQLGHFEQRRKTMEEGENGQQSHMCMAYAGWIVVKWSERTAPMAAP